MSLPDFRQQEPASGFDANALTRALRIAGAVLVVASASTFMLQGWQGGNDLHRYAMLVGQSLLLTGAAYFVGLTVREGRSARTFLALVLASIPVTFAVLGGLVYSQFHLEPLETLPSYASWVAPSPSTALLAVAATVVVLVPLAIVAFVALARKQWRALTLSFVAGNLLMLVPARAPSLIIAVAGALLLGLIALERSRFSRELDTLEGKLARVVLFVPPLIMLGRVIHLYRPTAAFYGGGLLIAAAALWLWIPSTGKSRWRDAGACLCAALGTAGWITCFSELWPQVRSSAPVLLLGLPCAAIAFASALRSSSARPALSAIGLVSLLSTAAIGAVTGQDALSAMLGVAVGIGVAVWGAASGSKLRMIAGSAVAVVGLGTQLWMAMHADDLLRWVSLTAAGVLLIIGASYVERHRVEIARRFAPDCDASG
jgi:hypothetical protein